MFSPILSRYSKPSSCLVFLFFIFCSFHHFPCTLSQEAPHLCNNSFTCGNITVGFPFWGELRPEICGHPSLGLRCNRTSNMTFLIISDMMYYVLEINSTFNTLRLARQDFLGDFCSASFSSATLTPQLFELAPDYRTLSVHYLCKLHSFYNATFLCPQHGLGSMDQNDEKHQYCDASFNINVPMSYVPEEKDLDLKYLKSVLKHGFKVKLKIDKRPCQTCESTGGFCNYRDNATQVCCKASLEVNCLPMFPPELSGAASTTLEKSSLTREAKLGIGLVSAILGCIAVVGSIICKVLSSHHRKRETSHHRSYHDLNALIPLKQYSYSEVKKITKSFTHIIGKGGFGIVYKGSLFDGRNVAVKILKDSNRNGEDFINEVASISQTSHVNIVSLLGFCYESCNRAIVYEFLENGSLDQFISGKRSLELDMNTLYGIVLGVARGIEYLHYGCKTRIVHFDIKPQNILLDNNLCPKVSDFGLAKLCEKRESVMSLLDTRGTIGYIAPEVFSRMYGVISHKSDVYSYGMLILDMIGARSKEIEENVASNASSTYFPDWIYKNVENGEYKGILGDEISEEDNDIGQKMILVGLWCIQPRPSDRPPMNRVVEMLEGSLDTLQVPPKPVLQSPEASLGSSKGSTVYSEV